MENDYIAETFRACGLYFVSDNTVENKDSSEGLRAESDTNILSLKIMYSYSNTATLEKCFKTTVPGC